MARPHITVYLICLIVIVWTTICYISVSNFDFIAFDDGSYVFNNSHINSGISISNIRWAFTAIFHGNWHPLTWLSHMLDCHVYGLNPGAHHITNLQFHLINTILLYIIFYLLTKKQLLCGLLAFLFAMHPLHVESVVWIAERKDMLSTCFGLLSILYYIKYIKNKKWASYAAMIFFYILSLMSKQMFVTLPFLLLLLDIWPLNRLTDCKQNPQYFSKHIRHILYEKWPLFVLSILFCCLAIFTQHACGTIKTFESIPLSTRLANACYSYISYLTKTIWPYDLAVFYPYSTHLSLWQIIGSVLFLFGMTGMAIGCYRQYPYVTVGWFWYIIMLLPVIGIIQIGSQSMADRYTYMPLTGIFIMVIWRISSYLKTIHPQKTIILLFITGVMTWLTVCTTHQISYWENSITLFQHTLKVTSNNHLAHTNIASAYYQSKQYKQALYHYQKAFELGQLVEIACSMGKIYEKLGDMAHAEASYQMALSISPNHIETRLSYVELLKKQNKDNNALKQIEHILKIEPDHLEALILKSNLLIKLEKKQDALDCLLHAIHINPNHETAHFYLGNYYLMTQQYEKGLTCFQKVIELNPLFYQAYNNIGVILSHIGKYKGAESFFKKALDIQPNYDMAKQHIQILYKDQNK